MGCEHENDYIASILSGLTPKEREEISRTAFMLANRIPEGTSITFIFEREKLVAGPGGKTGADVLGFLVVSRPSLAVPWTATMTVRAGGGAGR